MILDFRFKNLLSRIFKPRVNYRPLIEVRVFKSAILHNLKTFQKAYPKFQFAPVLKSNAYGHGLVEVAQILDNQNLPFFMADSFYEALVLKRAGIKTKILILGFVRPAEILQNKLRNASYGIIDLEILKNLSVNAKQKISIHLKIDTGMHRQGVLLEQVDEAIRLIKNNQNILLEGVCSHFADADGSEKTFTEDQISKWNQTVEKFKENFNTVKYFHISNTAGTYYLPEINANIARIGIGLYGFNTSMFKTLPLKPAMEMVSIVTSLKTIPPGEKVGYNVTYTAPHTTKVATVPVGYNEGLDVRLSNKGFVKIKNIFCPIVGRISMNMCSVDVTVVPDLQLEEEVVVISKNPEDKNSIDNIIKICNTNRYEIPIHVRAHLKRVIL